MNRPWPPTPAAVLCAVTPGEERPLKVALARLNGARWFEDIDEVHFARLVVVGQVPVVPGFPAVKQPLRMRYLLLTALVDLPGEGFFERLRTRCSEQVDEVWSHCVGYPGHDRARQFHLYLRNNSLHASQTYTAYDAGVGEVREALALRRSHGAFALEAQHLHGARLREAFREHFGVSGRSR